MNLCDICGTALPSVGIITWFTDARSPANIPDKIGFADFQECSTGRG